MNNSNLSAIYRKCKSEIKGSIFSDVDDLAKETDKRKFYEEIKKLRKVINPNDQSLDDVKMEDDEDKDRAGRNRQELGWNKEELTESLKENFSDNDKKCNFKTNRGVTDSHCGIRVSVGVFVIMACLALAVLGLVSYAVSKSDDVSPIKEIQIISNRPGNGIKSTKIL